MLKDRRIGRFEITLDVINDHPDAVLAIMSKVIVVEATNHFAEATVRYTAICEDFEPLPDGMMFPDYDPEFDEETGEISWTQC
ncbi:hypothetical protein RCZAHN_60 [Rhodobacter phage RcZahn]|nr:hypothetical protein RCZAHN_60 [Rhodobacter phage RcZahn]